MQESLAYIFLFYVTLHYLVVDWSRKLWQPKCPDIVILCHALFRDDSFSMGAIVAKRLNLNRTKGPILGGIFASRLAVYFNIPISKVGKSGRRKRGGWPSPSS